MTEGGQPWQALFGPLLSALRPEGIEASLQWADQFRQAAQQYLEGLRSQLPADPEILLQSLKQQAQRAPQLWAPAAVGGDPQWSGLGAGREHQQRWQRLQQASQRAAQAQQRLQQLWAEALQRAVERFAMQLPTSAAQAQSARPDALYNGWIDCAETDYAALAHTDAYADAQADWINASSELRHEARSCVEQWCAWLDLPTRSELKTLERRVQSLEQQLRGATGARDPT